MINNATAKLRAWAEINLSHLERNLRHIRASLPPHLQYIAVVKADAYGHGMAPVVTRLMHCGADMFAVANLSEAAEIRELGSGWPILVLSPILPEEATDAVEYDVLPAISSLEEVDRFEAVAKAAGRRVHVHLKIDTGMGRSGVWHQEVDAVFHRIQQSSVVKLAGVFTHFSCADSDAAFTLKQRQCFIDCLQRIQFKEANILIHADNSAGLDSFPVQGTFNGVRVGLLQFGIRPHPFSLLSDLQVEPVFSFHTRVGLVKQLPSGTGISYGRTHTLSRTTRVAVLTAGYGDGIPTSLSNCGAVLIQGVRCPILGRVTMDQTIVDVSQLDSVHAGEVATLVGNQGKTTLPVTEFAATAGQIPWEVFCSVTKRVPRIYRTDSAH